MKRLLSLIMAMGLLLGLVPAAMAQAAEPGWKEDTSPVTLTWFVDANWYANRWNTANAEYITKKTGVTIDFVVPAGDTNQELTVMMASNTLPDILSVGFWQPTFNKLWEGGFVYPLNELADQYDLYFYDVAGAATLNWYKQADGNTYCMPNEAYTEQQMRETGATNANQTFLVRKDLYEALGSPDMRTPESFLDALRKLKAEYPEFKGEPITPMTIQNAAGYGLGEYIQNFLAVPYEKDGKVYDRTTDPAYVKWLKVLRQAYEEGLVTADILIGDTTGEKTNNGRYFCMLQEYTGVVTANTLLHQKDPESVYIAVDGPANDSLDKPTNFPGSMTGWLPVFISKSCQHPERAIRFIAYWASEEGQRDFFLGEEGVTWDMADGKETMKPEVLAEYQTDVGAFETKYGIMDTYWQLRNPVIVYKWRPQQADYIQQMQDWANANVDFSGGIYKSLDPTGESEAAIAATKIATDWEQTLSALITAPSEAEFDTEWNNFLTRRQENGFDLVVAFRQQLLEERKAKLQ